MSLIKLVEYHADIGGLYCILSNKEKEEFIDGLFFDSFPILPNSFLIRIPTSFKFISIPFSFISLSIKNNFSKNNSYIVCQPILLLDNLSYKSLANSSFTLFL